MREKVCPERIWEKGVRTTMLGLCLFTLGCGGGDAAPSASQPITLPPSAPTPTPVPTPAPAPSPAPSPANFQAIIDAAENFDDSDFAIIIGDSNGIIFEYEKGVFPVSQQRLIASSTKWFTSATIMRLVENGVMDLSDHPQQYLSYWTSDPADPRSEITLEQLLSFTSGFNASPRVDSCVADGSTTIQTCAEEIYGFDIASDPGTTFAYGPHHMQIAAAMAERATGLPFNTIFRDIIANPLGMSQASTYLSPSISNPRAAGGAATTSRDYALFLQAILNGSLIADRDRFLEDRTDAVTFLFRPDGAEESGDWHYALGAWLECDADPFVPACTEAQIYSSPGSFGWTPWIDFQNGYFALIARRGDFASADIAISLEQILQPLIVEALSN
ncbi:serine hydrolase domain-containing protein [Sphingorhabdus sp. Alg231-15]|uniref:serine hydrolase domain-containing protein n=1 Tax=Sphingorhabdus sp. Alg231-15 TaxID=1922222 RepID=UPI00307B72B6